MKRNDEKPSTRGFRKEERKLPVTNTDMARGTLFE